MTRQWFTMKCWIVVLVGFLQVAAAHYQPVAHKEAMIVAGQVRFTVLTPRLIRLEWAPDGKFEDRASLVFVNRRLPVPSFKIRKNKGWLILQTEYLTLKYRLGSGAFTANNLRISFTDRDTAFTWQPGMKNAHNLKGTAYSLDDHNGPFHRDTGQPLQLFDGLISRDGWVLIDDSHTALLDHTDWPWAAPRPHHKLQDWYFLAYGHDYKTALYDFTRVAARQPLPPRLVFGIWWSRFWEYTDQELRQLVMNYANYQLPLDVLVVDMDWHLTSLPEFFEHGQRKRLPNGKLMGWTGFTWNRNYFPNPEEFLSWVHQHNIAVGLNLHFDVGILPHEAGYGLLARALGINPTTQKPIPFRFFNKRFVKNFFDIILNPLEKQGVNFWWLDWQNWKEGEVPGVNNLFWLNYLFYTHSRQEGKRPVILSRYAGLGSHRFPVGFSGDASISWQSLDFQPYFTATAANVLYGYWSHDIGGHTRGDSPPELFTRWVQFGAFSPIFRTHATKNPEIERRIWAYPLPFFQAMKKAMRWRERLIPYIYTAAYQAFQSGVSICHPLYYEYPRENAAYQVKNEYFFGDRILVHPITHPLGKDSLFTFQKVWLPPGYWIEWETGTILRGGQTVRRPFMLDEIPVYVKLGAIIPMQLDPLQKAVAQPNPLVLKIFPEAPDSVTIYEDDGNSLAYQQGEFAFIPVKTYATKSGMEIVIQPVRGHFPGMRRYRSYVIELPLTFAPASVKVNGQPLPYQRYANDSCWTYKGETLETRIFLPEISVDQSIRVEVHFARQDLHSLSGLPGKIKRLQTVEKFIATQHWDQSRFSRDVIVRNAQLGLRLSQEPRRMESMIEAFDRDWQRIVTMLAEVSKHRPEFKPYWQLLKVTQNRSD